VKNTNKFTERDHQLLSAYLDGELSQRDKAYVDRLLAENSHAQKAYQELKKIKSLLRFLPTRKVPRNFTLSAHETRKFNIPSLAGVFRYSTAVSAVLLVIVLALDVFSPLQTRSLIQFGTDFADSGTFEGELSMESQEEIPQMMEAAPLLEKEEIVSEPKFSSEDEESQVDSTAVEDLDNAQTEGAPLPEEEEIAPEPNLSPDDEAPQMGSSSMEEPEKASTEVEDRGAIVPVFSVAPLRIIELVLACLTVISALLAYLFRKREKKTLK
jgi:hypothetical protein